MKVCFLSKGCGESVFPEKINIFFIFTNFITQIFTLSILLSYYWILCIVEETVMKLKFLSALTGLILIGFGFSLQPLHSDSKLFTPNKLQMKNRAKIPTANEVRKSLRSFMSVSERKLYNKIREIASNKKKATSEKIDEIVKIADDEKLTRSKKNLALSNAVLVAHMELKEDARTETLKKLNEKAPQAKWLLKKTPNPNLIKLSELQYTILTGPEDL